MERGKVNKIENSRSRTIAYCDKVKDKYFDQIRYAVDKSDQWLMIKIGPRSSTRNAIFKIFFIKKLTQIIYGLQ